jgi:hypothetical protein
MTVGVLALVACSPAEAPTFTNGTNGRLDASTTLSPDAVPSFEASTRDAIPVPDRGVVVISEDASCSTTTADARRLPVNLLIVLDRSGSMADRGKWTAAVTGLRTLLGRLDPGIRVGLTMFPAPAGAGAADRVATYDTPIVPIEALGTNRARLDSVLSGASPTGNTPMNCATEGSRNYYGAFTMDGSRNVILITDGVPTSECTTAPMCALFPPDFACLLAQGNVASNEVRVSVARGARGTPPIRYFVAGTPDASDTFLSDLAFTGNTPRTPDCQRTTSCHYSLQTGSFEADLTRALDDIRGRAVSCEFAVDADPSRVDPSRVNVNVTAGGAATIVPRDVDHNNGWDYSPGMRSVVLHGPACTRVLADDNAQVRIVFGCPTVTPG